MTADHLVFNCPTCSEPMTLRNGKYGEFYYCKHKHGTISKRAADILLHRCAPRSSGSISQYSPSSTDVLTRAITRTSMSISRSMDDLGLLIEHEVDANEDDESWMNDRPY